MKRKQRPTVGGLVPLIIVVILSAALFMLICENIGVKSAVMLAAAVFT